MLDVVSVGVDGVGADGGVVFSLILVNHLDVFLLSFRRLFVQLQMLNHNPSFVGVSTYGCVGLAFERSRFAGCEEFNVGLEFDQSSVLIQRRRVLGFLLFQLFL